ncbi:MAG: hypothetical protein E4G90_09535 [Gemmatimonadales bacterium]|nr:MAG: hypothetical protein E4G90_09535 [Gemmatimonadales bacterium]
MQRGFRSSATRPRRYVLLHALSKREPLWRHSARGWNLAEADPTTASTSAITFNACSYVMRELAGADSAYQASHLLRDIFHRSDLSAQLLFQALAACFTAFENTIRYLSAVRVQADVLITRNPDDCPRAGLSILTSRELLALHSPHGSGNGTGTGHPQRMTHLRVPSATALLHGHPVSRT